MSTPFVLLMRTELYIALVLRESTQLIRCLSSRVHADTRRALPRNALEAF
jgi:hypothetical protein